MPPDYSGQNLRGRSFKGQNLEGANFSYADIRGIYFTGANLRGTDFTGAKAGLQKRWALLLVLLSWLLLGISSFVCVINSFFISYIFDYSQDPQSQFTSLVAVIVTIIAYIIIIHRGISVNIFGTFVINLGIAGITMGIVYGGIIGLLSVDQSLALVGAIFGALVLAGAFAFVLTFAFVSTFGLVLSFATAFAISFTVGGIFAGIIAGIFAFVNTITFSVLYAAFMDSLFKSTAIFPGIFAVAVSAFFLAGIGTVISAYIAWRAIKKDKKYASIRNTAVAIATIGGTSFRNADLTDTNFSKVTFKGTDLRGARLIRTSFHKSQFLDRIRPGTSYLKNYCIRQLLTTGQGQNKIFDRQDLRGINLKEANLAGASFIDTDLSQANLQESDLFEAKLVQTNLDQTNLNNACLTGAYIEDWGITRKTSLDNVKCKYVYLKLPTEGDRDPNRMPPPEEGDFEKNGFNIFVTSVLDTLDLYHRNNVNAGMAITILKSLTKDYPVQFELVGLEKRGDNQFIIRLKVFGQTSHFQLQREYYARYEQTLPLYDPKKLMPSTDVVVEEIIQTVKENPGTHIENLHNQGIFITGGSLNRSNDRTIHTGGSNYNECIEGDYTEIKEVGNMTNNQGGFSVGGDIGGNVNNVQGDNNQGELGDNNQVTQQNQVGDTPPLTKEKVIELLVELEALVKGAELPEETKEEVVEDLSSAKKAANREEPNKNRALDRLGSVAETLEKTSKTVESGQKLWSKAKPIMVKVASWLGAAAGSHLLGL